MLYRKVFFRLCLPLALLWMPAYFFESCSSKNAEIISAENIFSAVPFKECHAASIAETSHGLLVAFFAGTAEKNPDVGIWLCRYEGGRWTAPAEVVNGIQADGTRYACWNPVLFQVPDGPLLLFYKVGPNPVEWWGMLTRSNDGGTSWSDPVRLPEGILGPVKNKPVMLENGSLLCPSSVESDRWHVRMELTTDTGKTWSVTGIDNGEGDFDAIQPSVLRLSAGKLQILCRSRQNVIVESWSEDNGVSWSPLRPTSLPNPNSGIDAVTIDKHLHLLVYNPTVVPEGRWTGDRTPLCVASSPDGKKWNDVLTLEKDSGEYSYPAVTKSSDGLIHIVYTWKRESIKHVVIKP